MKPKAAAKAPQKDMEVTDPKLGTSVRIPSPPPLLLKINHLLAEPTVSLEKIAKVIQTDAGLTASLFRLLARPAYGLRRPPDTIAQALSLVGLTTLADLVKGLSLEVSIYGDSPFYAWFWERANDIAAYASAIAWRQRSVCNVFPEHAYMAALFEDCGVPILVQHINGYEGAFVTGQGYLWPDVPVEDARFSTDHAVVGYLAARHWKLPDFVCQAVRWHHEPINVNDKAATLVAILQTAEHIYNRHAMKPDQRWEAEKAGALAELGVAQDGLREFEEDIYDRVQAGQR